MKNFTFLLLFILVVACEQNELVNPEGAVAPLTACGTSNPLEELEWLKTMVEDPQLKVCPVHTVKQGRYMGETVFMPDNLGALCCGFAGYQVFNCEGELLFAGEPEKDAKITDIKTIYTRN